MPALFGILVAATACGFAAFAVAAKSSPPAIGIITGLAVLCLLLAVLQIKNQNL